MKIGILTLPLHTNYGGILQAYALQTVLERLGNDVKVIDYDYLMPIPSRWKLFKRWIKSIMHIQTLSVDYEKKQNEPEIIKRKYTQPFINKYIHRLPIKNLERDLHEGMFDCIVVGSDQIWRPLYVKMVLGTTPPNAFLQFAEGWNIKRIAYAASFGRDEWEYSEEETIVIKELIKKFDAISVREYSGMKMCREYLGVSVQQVVDPTLLLSKNDYLRLCPQNYKYKGEYIFIYILDDTERNNTIVEKTIETFSLKPIKAHINEKKEGMVNISQLPVEEWLLGLENAKYVITDSFHGCVFSIIFKKPFVVIGNNERGIARISSLLSMLDLQNRMIKSVEDITKVNFETYAINKLEEIKLKSLEFLTDSLRE